MIIRQIQGSKILPKLGIEPQSPSSQSDALAIRPQRPRSLLLKQFRAENKVCQIHKKYKHIGSILQSDK